MAAQIPISMFLLHSFFINILLFSPTLIFASSLSFNLTNSDKRISTNIIYERAFLTNQGIELTGDLVNTIEQLTGRATYFQPFHLWDKASGILSSFQTHFSFAINSGGRERYGDGLTFFFAPNGSKLNPIFSRGGNLGMNIDPQPSKLEDNLFFAVEFDTHRNIDYSDPPYEHVGIDINSMVSNAHVIWKCDIKGGKKTDVWIGYDSVSHSLNVTFTGFEKNNRVFQKLDYVVDLRYLPEWVTFGFSAATGSQYATHTIYSWDFKSNLNLTSNPNVASSPIDRSNTNLIVGLGVGGFVLVGGLIMVWIIFWKKKSKKEVIRNVEMDIVLNDDSEFEREFERGTRPRKFSYDELARATNNFREDEKLGEGGFGGVYKGFLRDLNCYVAVKKVSKESKQGIKEFASEVNIISQLRHRNLVQLIGWCHERDELLLVYEFMPNGSLDVHLFKKKNNFLAWELRYKIAKGIASALLYLHEGWENCVVHRDIKPSNVMLDSNFNAKLGDFGLARLIDHTTGSQTTVVAGTMGYMAPECATTGKASKESDVYSFGVVSLEIATGRRPFNVLNENEGKMEMVEWAWELYGSGNLLEATDPKLEGCFEDEQQRKQMECLMLVGLWCAHPDKNCRPSIRQAILVLNFEAPLPLLPSKMPQPIYQSLPVKSLQESVATMSTASLLNSR